MKTNFRGKVREFLASEDGKVGLKAPLTLGVVTGSILLAQAIIGPTSATAGGPCHNNWQCRYPPHICVVPDGSCLTQ